MIDDDRDYVYDEEYYYHQERAEIKASGSREALDDLDLWLSSKFMPQGFVSIDEMRGKIRLMRKGLG